MSPYDVFSSELVAWMTFGSLYDLLLVSVLDRKLKKMHRIRDIENVDH